MKKFLLVSCVLALSSLAIQARAAEVSCYNDDSQDVINQDELRIPMWGGPAPIPNPADCATGPAVTISGGHGTQGQVRVDGAVAYDDRMDMAVEARVAPSGTVAILTERGSLFTYSKKDGLRPFLRAHVHSVREFRMARDGGVVAVSNDGALVVDGRVGRAIHTVQRLYAAASGRLVALMSDGSVVDAKGKLYGETVDPAVEVKVAADGTVAWLTRDGDVGTTRKARLFDGVDPAVAFKVTPSGVVAYLTRDGSLGRDGEELLRGVTRVAKFKIHPHGAVTAIDADGRAHYIP